MTESGPKKILQPLLLAGPAAMADLLLLAASVYFKLQICLSYKSERIMFIFLD